MRYYGNKTKLLGFIEQAVKKTGLNGTSRFVDMFSGTCAVGRHFKKLGYTVIANDTLEFSYALSKTFIELNRQPRFTKLKNALRLSSENQSIFDHLNSKMPISDGFFFQNYSPNGGRKYFTDENARRIDTVRTTIHNWKQSDLLTELEYYYLITSLLRAVNLVSNVSGTYGAFLKEWDKRAFNPLVLNEVEIISSETKNKAYKRDANDLISELSPDILYLDPPYNGRQYASNYFILELIAEGWFDRKPEIYGQTGMRPYDNQKSLYASKSYALKALEDLVLNSTKAQYVLLSYNDEGIIPHPAIIDTLSRIGEVQQLQQPHVRYKSVNQKDGDPRTTSEHLFIVRPRNPRNPTNHLSGKEWLRNSFSIWRDLAKNEEERRLKHPAIFTIRLATKLIETFSRPEETLILDCFAGSGSTLIAGLLNKKRVVGFDLNPEYKELFESRAVESYGIPRQEAKAAYIVGDSRKLAGKIAPNTVDLCITSPPYWDILNQKRSADYKENINYSEDKRDLGNIGVYGVFLDELEVVFKQVHTVLKPGCYFILNVMDLRKKDQFFPLHADASARARQIGFKLEDIIIWDRQPEYNNMRPLGYPFKFIVNKVHEYILIFSKAK